MGPIAEAETNQFRNVRFVLTDMDETLTYKGRLTAAAYDALERLQASGVQVIPVTAAPAGWCDQMARMWPVDGVIGENGGLFFRRIPEEHGLERHFWHPEAELESIRERLTCIGRDVCTSISAAKFAEDQPFRLTSVALRQLAGMEDRSAIARALQKAGASVTINNLWILGWLGDYDKLVMSRRILSACYNCDIDLDRDAVAYVGDSTNDAPMFDFFNHTFGVSTVRDYLAEIPTPPNWITKGPGGAGFVEVANAIIASRP
jgi:HAD superfamily hydrolase (TIGR01484 family)